MKGGGNSPTLEWYVNGELRGTGATLRYMDSAWNATTPDTIPIRFKMISSSSCATPQEFYKDTFLVIRPLQDIDLEIEPIDNLCTQIVKEPVVWQTNGNPLNFYDGYISKHWCNWWCGYLWHWYNGGAIAKQLIYDNGSVSFTPGYVGSYRMTHPRRQSPRDVTSIPDRIL